LRLSLEGQPRAESPFEVVLYPAAVCLLIRYYGGRTLFLLPPIPSNQGRDGGRRTETICRFERAPKESGTGWKLTA